MNPVSLMEFLDPEGLGKIASADPIIKKKSVHQPPVENHHPAASLQGFDELSGDDLAVGLILVIRLVSEGEDKETLPQVAELVRCRGGKDTLSRL